jgi:hypothetical protein
LWVLIHKHFCDPSLVWVSAPVWGNSSLLHSPEFACSTTGIANPLWTHLSEDYMLPQDTWAESTNSNYSKKLWTLCQGNKQTNKQCTSDTGVPKD